MTIIYFLLLLSVIIIIHELGHLIAAKYFHVYCYEFSFGMGPLLWKKQGKETQYSIRALPIGGYVAMAGDETNQEVYPDIEVPADRTLPSKPWWQKIIIMLAGVTMNFILAFLIFSLVMLSYGEINGTPRAVVGEVVASTPAEKAGLQNGDVIVELHKDNGESTKPTTFMDLQEFFFGYEGVETYVVERNGETLTFDVQPEYNEESNSYLIGIRAEETDSIKINLLNCWGYGLNHMANMTKSMLRTLANLFRGRGLNQLSGPVGIYQAAGTYASQGLRVFLQLIAMLSLNVGIFNLLPLPVLDGGQVVITLIEAAIQKELSEKLKVAVMSVCWIVLIGLMVFVTWNDIVRILQ